MVLNTTRISLATSAAVAMIAAAALLSPASAQSKTWPAGTDCTKLVGNDKTDCEHQAKNTAAPDNSNNPDNAEINNTKNGTAPAAADSMTTSTTKPNYEGKDCTKLVGQEKTECAAQNKQHGAPDNSNNPAQSDPAQSN
jgi:hypothetical protein